MTLQLFLPKDLHRLARLRTSDLAPRERELALAMCGTASPEAIAARAGLSIGTYRQYAKRIYSRLGVSGREGVAPYLDS